MDLLLKVSYGDQYGEVDYVRISSNNVQWWKSLLQLKDTVLFVADRLVDNRFYGIQLFDWSPEVIEEMDLDEELLNNDSPVLLGTEYENLEESENLHTDMSMLVATTNGIYWEFQLKYSGIQYTTAIILWDVLENLVEGCHA